MCACDQYLLHLCHGLTHIPTKSLPPCIYCIAALQRARLRTFENVCLQVAIGVEGVTISAQPIVFLPTLSKVSALVHSPCTVNGELTIENMCPSWRWTRRRQIAAGASGRHAPKSVPVYVCHAQPLRKVLLRMFPQTHILENYSL